MKRKIIIYLVTIFVFFAVGISMSIIAINDATEELNSIIELHKVEQLRRSLIIRIQTVQSNLYTVRSPLRLDLDEIVTNVTKLEERAKECSSCHHSPRLNTRIIKMQSLIKDYGDRLSHYITLRSNPTRVDKLQREAALMGDKIVYEAEKMSHGASTHLESLTRESNENIQRIKTVLIATMIVSLFLSVLIAAFLTRSVTYPVKKLLDATRKISSGQLGATVTYNDRTEFGELAQNFNQMSTELQKRQETLKVNAEELRKRIKELEEFYDMAVGRELRMKELKQDVEKLKSEISRYKKSGS
jgi:HAMP domain-containing protein